MKHLIGIAAGLLLITNLLIAQPTKEKGIIFFQGSWKELLKEAQKKDKLIFVDVYTDWCAPCKQMDKFIFTKAQVGNVYNSNFINFKLNAEEGEGIELAKRFGIEAYPSFVFLNSSGKMIHKVVGERDETELIGLLPVAKAAGNNPNNLGNLEQQFAEGNRTPVFLRNYIKRLAENNLDNGLVLDAYLDELPEESRQQDSTIIFVANNINSIHSAALILLIKNFKQLPATEKAAVNNTLFEKLIRTGAGESLNAKRLLEYESLMEFSKQLNLTNPNQQALINRYELIYGRLAADYDRLKNAGYAIVGNIHSIPADSIHGVDRIRYAEIMKPFLSGEKDSTKIAGFEEEKKYIINLYSREIAEKLFTSAKAFERLPASDKNALQDAVSWIDKCLELLPETSIFSDLRKQLLKKLSA